jgi:hypothetical protein
MPQAMQDEIMYKMNHHQGVDDETKLFELFAEDDLIAWGHEFKKTPFGVEMERITNDEAEMPITPRFDEKYGSLTIVFSTENEKAFLETNLDIEKTKAYNSKYIGNTYVMKFDKFAELWRKNTGK